MPDENAQPTSAPPTPPPAAVPPPAVKPSPVRDAEQAAELDEAASRAPIHERDHAPSFLLRTQEWLHSWLSNESRLVLGIVIVFLAVFALFALSSVRFLRIVFDALNIVAFIGLFLVNWLGNGGVLVPIPGARFIGLLMIFQQAVLMPSWEVFAVSGAAMSLGLLSYYIAGARTAQSYAEGDAAGAEQLAAETGMLDEEQLEFSPGAELEAEAVSAISGVEATDSSAASSTASSAASAGDGPVGDDSAVVDPAADSAAGDGTAGNGAAAPPGSRFERMRRRFTTSLKKTQERAQPIIEQRGAYGMFLLCFAPTPMGTAAAYLGGLMRFGFSRYLLASFAAKYLLAGIIVILALVFSDVARGVQIPEIELPIVDITLFNDGLPALPSPAPSGEPAASGLPTD